MDGFTDGWTDGWANGRWMGGRAMDGRTGDGWADGRWMGGRAMDGRMSGWIDGWMDGRTDGWTESRNRSWKYRIGCFFDSVEVLPYLQGVEQTMNGNHDGGRMWTVEALLHFKAVSRYLVGQREKRTKLGQQRYRTIETENRTRTRTQVLTIQALPSIGKTENEQGTQNQCQAGNVYPKDIIWPLTYRITEISLGHYSHGRTGQFTRTWWKIYHTNGRKDAALFIFRRTADNGWITIPASTTPLSQLENRVIGSDPLPHFALFRCCHFTSHNVSPTVRSGDGGGCIKTNVN
jgi:hypothetical protein